jgi:hypothetical protein
VTSKELNVNGQIELGDSHTADARTEQEQLAWLEQVLAQHRRDNRRAIWILALVGVPLLLLGAIGLIKLLEAWLSPTALRVLFYCFWLAIAITGVELNLASRSSDRLKKIEARLDSLERQNNRR